MNPDELKRPEDCRDMADVRAAIDGLDRETVRLLGERARYVEAAAKFKTSASSVRASERQKAMLEDRRSWATEENLDADFVEALYGSVVSHFIGREMREWESSS
ncbi:MAG: chorismate mutase [Rubrobacter sp.]